MKKFVKSLFQLSGALIVSLILWEVLLRVFFTVPIVSDHVEALGWLPKNARGMSTTEGRGHVVYNEYGFREGPLENKPKDELRVLVLGDSNIEARQMDLDKTLPVRLQILLDETPGASDKNCRVRVVNGGRVGATPAFHVALADEYKELFQPDWTVVFVEDDRWKLTFSPIHEMRYEPEGNNFKIVTKWQGESRGRGYQILRKLHIRDLALFDWSFSRWQLMNGVGGGGDANGEGAAERAAAKGNALQRAAYANMKNPEMIARSMNWTLRQLREKYPNLVIVHMPAADAGNANLKPVTLEERELMQSCRDLQIPVIAMRERLAEDYQKTGKPPFGFMNTLPWTGHINAHGHDVIAHALRDYFADKLCVAPPGVAASHD
ncbi:MAG TPA: hypothetical protein VGB77_08450 [Abditibacteriaceae bacterium]|jgi:hypothetical protein